MENELPSEKWRGFSSVNPETLRKISDHILMDPMDRIHQLHEQVREAEEAGKDSEAEEIRRLMEGYATQLRSRQ